ncbi:MAG TPA: zinc-binding dehydrogenase, partial [Candidatus Binatia bacterium]|nr:zinc-binding dehydrogenase [Candidatus Binatia bacterium]
MRAAVLYEARQPLKIEELEMPGVGDEDVLIKVASCGVCHTDLKVVEGRNRFTPPTILGHEVAGTVEQVGAYCKDFKAGDRVIIGMRYKCGRCRYCLSARENLCERRPAPPVLKKTDGTTVTRWNVGGFAEYVSVPGYMIFKIPEAISMEEASVVGCRVTTAYNAVKHRARLEPGNSALVIGCGGIGLNTIQFLKCFGAYPIIAVDIANEKLDAAKSFGATHTINAAAEDPVKAVVKLTEGGVDKAFEAIGNPKTADQIIQSTRPGGTATIIGGLGSGPFTISSGNFVTREITITGVSSRQANDVEEVFQMAKLGRIELKNLITKSYRYDQINEALADLE